ncbi:hypothetical protein LCGC14_2036890 [marine sediment metagenome]|uniref:Uncharacterized protein n=1 Tax=marine sediment metagenome TaxID=412755 RepID=A0A0F9HQ21_9ZZZZ
MKKKIKEERPEGNIEIKEKDTGLPLVKKRFTQKAIVLASSGLVFIVGFICFVIYMNTGQMLLGTVGILVMVPSAALFKYYWGKSTDVLVIEHLGKPLKEQVNSLCIYPDKVIFENVYEPVGYPWECTNDGKKYFVNILDTTTKKLIPFVLPDQQFYDPGVFAERVLALPAHRKIFARKPTLFQALKTGLLVVAIGIMFVLILTTTGGA